MVNKIRILKKLDKVQVKYDGAWMGKNPNYAFLISLGAGPWKEKRRYNVQKHALDWYKNKNVSDIRNLKFLNNEKVFPFDWQNNFLINMTNSVKDNNDLFESLCLEWKIRSDWKNSLEELFFRCGTSKKGSKVLWMFARDFLELPSFPIDRWVRRTLEENNLPVCPYEIIDLCQQANIDPNLLNRKLFQGVNPDWSNY